MTPDHLFREAVKAYQNGFRDKALDLLLRYVQANTRNERNWLLLFIFEITPTLDILLNGVDYNLGHWAHLGGFFGALSIVLFLRPEDFRRYSNHLPM